MLKTLNSWYEKGYMDPEFVTDDRATQRSKWSDGQFGVLGDHPWWFAASTPDNVTDLILNKDSKAKLKFIEPFTGPNGKSGSHIGFPQVVGNAVYFGKDASDEVVKRIMAIEESFVVDKEWSRRVYWGVEGEHYNINSDGVLIPNSELMTAQKISELGLMQSFALAPSNKDDMFENTILEDRPPYEMAMSNNQVYSGVAFVTSGPNEVASIKGTDVTTIADEFFFDAVTGRINIDAEWDAYIQRLNSAGLQEIIEEYEKLMVK
jgi:putative aldouronate transport system substrate-binding protein